MQKYKINGVEYEVTIVTSRAIRNFRRGQWRRVHCGAEGERYLMLPLVVQLQKTDGAEPEATCRVPKLAG